MRQSSRVAIQGELGAFSECAALLLVDGAKPNTRHLTILMALEISTSGDRL